MRSDENRFSWLAGMATILSLLACYGTLAVLALLGMLGVAIALNETLWAGAIVTSATLALGGLAFGAARHRHMGPVLMGGFGAAAIAYAMYVNYSRGIEVTGFIFLAAAALRDWRLRHNRRS
jgi:MerC mercury resistance protein